MDFANTLSNLIEEKGMNSLRLSKEIGVADRLVGAWRKGEKRPTLDNLVLLADFFGVSLDFLVGRSEVREMATKKAPVLVISENGQEILRYFETLPEREQWILIGEARGLQLSAKAKEMPPTSDEKAV